MSCIRKRAPSASSPLVRKVMQGNVGRVTAIEASLQEALSEQALSFETDVRVDQSIRCKADIVFRPQKLCVFVDGCFWHGCLIHFKSPRSNAAWWAEKIQANVDRDLLQGKVLSRKGWLALRFWEHELEANLEACVLTVLNGLRRRGLKPN
jgi:DNA mismatch endonuclease, patch repair protein